MKLWLKLILLSAISYKLSANGGTFHCQWNPAEFVGETLSNRITYITPIAPYGVDSTTIITGDRRRYTNDSNGILIVSNLFNGRSYRVEFVGRYITTPITNSFDTNVTGLVNGADPAYLVAPVRDTGIIGFSQVAADARFHNTAGDTSTNPIFRGTIKIPEGATVGYVFTVTNSDGSGTWTGGVLTNSYSLAVNFPGGVSSPSFSGAVGSFSALSGVTLNISGGISGPGTGITALNASTAFGSGTLPDARFPATLPAVSGANLTSLNPANISAGTAGISITGAANTATNASDGVQIASTNYVRVEVSAGDAGPRHLNRGALLNTSLKLANNCQGPNIPGVLGITALGDNAIHAGSGVTFGDSINRGLASFLDWSGSLFGCSHPVGGGGIVYGTGTATFVAGNGNNAVWPGPYYLYANGQAVTNAYTGILGINATHLALNCAQSNGFGSFQVWTQSYGGTMALCRTVDNNNGGSYTPFTTNIWLGGTVTNCIAAVVSTDINITYGQVACGLYNTNTPSFIFDPILVSNGNVESAMTNAMHSNAFRVFLDAYFDGIIISDLNTSNAVYAGSKHFKTMMSPTASASSWRTDLILTTGSPNTNDLSASRDLRDGAQRVGLDYNIPTFDSQGFIYPDTPDYLFGLVPSGDVHFVSYVGKMIGTELVNWLGWNYGHQVQSGYTLKAPIPYVALTNGTAWGQFTIHPTNDRLMVVDSYNSTVTAIWMGNTAKGGPNDWVMAADSGTNTYLNSPYYLRLFDGGFGAPVLSKEHNTSLIIGNVFGNQADVGSGNVRFNGNVVVTGTLQGSNTLTLDTSDAMAFRSGTGARAGNAVLVAGTVTVNNTSVTANTVVNLTRKTAGGALGNLTYTLSAATSFTINSDNAGDTSVVSYTLIEVP